MAEGTIEQVISKLQEILNAVSECNAELDETCSIIKTSKDARDALLNEIKDDWKDLVDAGNHFAQSLADSQQTTGTTYQERVDDIIGFVSRIDICRKNVDDASQELPARIDENRTALKQAIESLSSSHAELMDEIASTAEQIGTMADRTESVVIQLQGNIDQLTRRVTGFTDKFSGNAEHAIEEIATGVLPGTIGRFDEFADAMDAIVDQRLNNIFSQVSAPVMQAIKSMFDGADQAAAAINNASNAAIATLVESAEEAKTKLQTARETTMESLGGEINKEIADTQEVFGKVAKCTESLSPVMPSLQSANRVLKEFSAILEEMSPG